MNDASAVTGAGADPLQGIQEVAAQLGITMRTLRFYEDKGLIAPQRVGTTRVYTKREIARMQLVLRGKRLGFSIREIKEFLDLYEADPAHLEQARRFAMRVRQRLAELSHHQVAIEQTIVELRALETEAQSHLAKFGG